MASGIHVLLLGEVFVSTQSHGLRLQQSCREELLSEFFPPQRPLDVTGVLGLSLAAFPPLFVFIQFLLY